MPKITFIATDNQQYPVEVESGITAMEAALDNAVPGIDGDCGGMAACGTCHVYVDPEFFDRVGGAAKGLEADMLGLTDEVAENSRLSCQITLTDEHEGLVLRIPQDQH